MSLSIFVKDPSADEEQSARHFMRPAGFESYRTQLWGTDAIAKRSPLLAEIRTDLFLTPEAYDDFERQCRRVLAEADDIARELGWTIAESPGTGSESVCGNEQIRMYVESFLEGVAFARQHKSPTIIIN